MSSRSTRTKSVSTNGGPAPAEVDLAELRRRMMTPAPFDSEPEACALRDACDYNVKITIDMAKNGTAPRKIRIYADGIYDLFHQGHARQLMQAKALFPKSEVYLLVGCCSDELTRDKKGETVMTEDERYEAIRHCRYVDEIVRNAPWSVEDDFLTKHKIDFVAHDELPYTTGSGEDVYKHLKERGMFVGTERTEGVSTSDIVARIVRNYDIFIRRNLARGYSRHDLNVSFFRGQKLRLQNKVDSVKEQVQHNVDRVKHQVQNTVDGVKHKWEETSREVVTSFMRKVFGSDNNEWNLYPRIMRALRSPNNSPPGSEDEEEDEHDQQIVNQNTSSATKRKLTSNGNSSQTTEEASGSSSAKKSKK